MKRTICLILMLAILLSCFACAKPADIEANATKAPVSAQTQAPTAALAAAPTPEPTAEPTQEPTPEPVSDPMPWEESPNEYSKATVELPCNFSERTESNEHIFSIEPFEISFALPTGWSIKDEPDENGLMFGFAEFMHLFSKQYIFDETGRCIGAFGYCCHEELEYGAMAEIYLRIGLGAHYYFNFLEEYTTITELENTVTEITDVRCDKKFMESRPDTAMYSEQDRINYGILSHNPNELFFVAFELCPDYVSEEQYMAIAQSLRFN